MIRGVAGVAFLVLAGAVPALAQSHSRSHRHGYPHGPEHVRPDSVTHAEMHARMHGTWTGSLSSQLGASAGVSLTVTHDSVRRVMLSMRTDQRLQAGVASGLVMKGDTLHWTQDLSGRACKATAVLNNATAYAPETIKGEMACADGDLTFTLQKKTG